MLEMWQFVVILFAAEFCVVLVAITVIWQRCRWTRKHRANINSDTQILHHVDEDMLMEDLFGNSAVIEYGHPPSTYGSLRLEPRARPPSYRRLNSVSQFRSNSPILPGSIRRASVLSTVTLPEVKEAAYGNDLASTPDSEYENKTLRSDLISPISSEPYYSGLTPVNTPSPKRAKKLLNVRIESEPRNDINLSRPKMGDDTLNVVESRMSYNRDDSTVDRGSGHVRFEPLWKTVSRQSQYSNDTVGYI